MDWQSAIVTVLIAVAAAYLARATGKTWFQSAGVCGSGCGACGQKATAEPTIIPPEQLRVRRRDGGQHIKGSSLSEQPSGRSNDNQTQHREIDE